MVDWLLQVTRVLKSSHDTFFSSVHILDAFMLHRLQEEDALAMSDDEIRLAGMVAVFVASQFNDP